MKRVLIFTFILIATACFGQNKTPITKIDDATRIWGGDSLLIRMRITASFTDTVATYYHYKLIKVEKVHHFKEDKFLKSQK
jgi:hypothetical protein